MKTTLLIFTAALLLFSCEKDDSISEAYVSEWLTAKIAEDESTIASDPKLMPNYGAWISYKFNGETYYEYDNPLSSLSRNPYSIDGEWIDTYKAPFTDYWDQKCCEEYIWQAPKYHKL